MLRTLFVVLAMLPSVLLAQWKGYVYEGDVLSGYASLVVEGDRAYGQLRIYRGPDFNFLRLYGTGKVYTGVWHYLWDARHGIAATGTRVDRWDWQYWKFTVGGRVYAGILKTDPR